MLGLHLTPPPYQERVAAITPLRAGTQGMTSEQTYECYLPWQAMNMICLVRQTSRTVIVFGVCTGYTGIDGPKRWKSSR